MLIIHIPIKYNKKNIKFTVKKSTGFTIEKLTKFTLKKSTRLTVKQLTGFTLIELVIVIVLIGILSAAALPKFASLIFRARQAAASGIAGGLSAAASIAHAQWLADGSPDSINLEGQLIFMSPMINGMGGWPEDTQSIGNGIATPDKCLAIWNGILNTPPKAAISNCVSPCQYMVSADSPLCKYQDRQGRGDNIITYNITTGAVDAIENNAMNASNKL